MLHAASSLVLVLIAAGVWYRRRPAIHVTLMATAFVVDVALVIYIEATRHAVERVVATTTPLIWVHAGISALVLVAYVVQLRLGRRLLAGVPASRRMHISVGLAFVSLRSLNYVTSFLL